MYNIFFLYNSSKTDLTQVFEINFWEKRRAGLLGWWMSMMLMTNAQLSCAQVQPIVMLLISFSVAAVVLSQSCDYPSACTATLKNIGKSITLIIDNTTLKWKCNNFDEFIIGCTGSCQNDNFQCSQWWKFCQNDKIFISVNHNKKLFTSLLISLQDIQIPHKHYSYDPFNIPYLATTAIHHTGTTICKNLFTVLPILGAVNKAVVRIGCLYMARLNVLGDTVVRLH